jgi:hypothetical protein
MLRVCSPMGSEFFIGDAVSRLVGVFIKAAVLCLVK